MYGEGCSKSANQNKDSSQQIEKSDDFEKKTLPLQSRRSSGNIQRLLNNSVGAAERVNGLRRAKLIENPGDIAITFDAETIDFQKDIACLNSG